MFARPYKKRSHARKTVDVPEGAAGGPITTMSGTGATWLPEQLARLAEAFPHMPIEEISKELGHTVSSCRTTAQHVGIKTRRQHLLTPSKVAEDLGVHPNTVLVWIRKGLIKATPSRTLSCKSGPVWDIDKPFYAAFRTVWFASGHRPSVARVAAATRATLGESHYSI